MRTLSGPATTRVGGPFPALYSVRRYVTSMPETTAPPPSRATQPSLELLDDLVYEVETVFHGKGRSSGSHSPAYWRVDTCCSRTSPVWARRR